MGAREFEIDQDAVLRIEARKGDSLRVRSGEIWLTQNRDRRDYVLRAGDTIRLNGRGATLATAFAPTQLELYRADPIAFRQRVERAARHARARTVWALLRKALA